MKALLQQLHLMQIPASCWYDFSVFVEGNTVFEKRYAGHIETGTESMSDPAMG